MPEAVAQKVKNVWGLDFIEGYGLSETIAASHSNPPQRPKKQCLGIPICDTDSRIIDPDTLAAKPQGETGEIVTHGPGVFQGYWNDPGQDRRPRSSSTTASASSAPATSAASTRTATSSWSTG